MQLVIHAGAHYTEQERLVKSLLRNQEQFGKNGVSVPGPGSYRKLLRDTLNAMHRTPASSDARDVLMDAILDNPDTKRLILSDANFFRTAGTAVQNGLLYPAAAIRMSHLEKLFGKDEMEIFIGIRSPASLLPIFFENAMDPSPGAFWGLQSPRNILWSDTIQRIRRAVPNVPITIWCAEDLPIIWEQVMRTMAGFAADERLDGAYDLLSTVISREGMKQLPVFLARHEGITLAQEQKVIAAFIEKFAAEGKTEEEVNMPDWTDELVEEINEIYDEDFFVIQNIPGVRVIEPS